MYRIIQSSFSQCDMNQQTSYQSNQRDPFCYHKGNNGESIWRLAPISKFFVAGDTCYNW